MGKINDTLAEKIITAGIYTIELLHTGGTLEAEDYGLTQDEINTLSQTDSNFFATLANTHIVNDLVLTDTQHDACQEALSHHSASGFVHDLSMGINETWYDSLINLFVQSQSLAETDVYNKLYAYLLNYQAEQTLIKERGYELMSLEQIKEEMGEISTELADSLLGMIKDKRDTYYVLTDSKTDNILFLWETNDLSQTDSGTSTDGNIETIATDYCLPLSLLKKLMTT